MPEPLKPERRRATMRVDHGPELLYVQRDGRTVRTLSDPNGLADLDPLDHHFLQALCLHVLNRLGSPDGGGPDGERHPLPQPVIGGRPILDQDDPALHAPRGGIRFPTGPDDGR